MASDGLYAATVHQVVLKACLRPVDGFPQWGHGGGFQKLLRVPILLKWVSSETRCSWHQAGAHPNALPAGFVVVAEMRMCNLLSNSRMEELIPGYSHAVTLPCLCTCVYVCDVFTASINHFQSHRRNYFGMLCTEGYFSMVITSHSCCAR